MIEYVFFHQQTLQRFVRFLFDEGVRSQTQEFSDRIEVGVADDLDDGLFERIDACYDDLMTDEADLTDAEQGSGPENYERAGITLNMKDGATVYADVDSQLLARVMSVISPQEFTLLVDAIVGAVEDREGSTYCQRLRGTEKEADV